MADDFEAGAGNAPGGPGRGNPVVGLSRRYRTNEEKLQEMRRHLRLQEERHSKAERMKKAREREMAANWLKHDKAEKLAKEEELKQRLAHLAGQEQRAAEKKAHKAEAGAAARTTIPSGGSANGGGLPGARNEAEVTPAPDSPGGNRGVAASGGVERERSLGRDRSRERSAPVDKGSPSSHKVSPALSPGRSGGVNSSGTSSWRLRKKKREEVATPRGLTIGQSSQQRSIMQEVQEQCQGLNKSTAGREILASGTQNEKKLRHAFVKGARNPSAALQAKMKDARSPNSALLALDMKTTSGQHCHHKVASQGQGARHPAAPQESHDWAQDLCQKLHQGGPGALPEVEALALQEVEGEAEEMIAEEEQEEEKQEQPNVTHKHMARRYRLRMMQQIQSQVLQCRKKMTLNFKQSLMSPRGLGCSPHVEAEDAPRSPASGQWIVDP